MRSLFKVRVFFPLLMCICQSGRCLPDRQLCFPPGTGRSLLDANWKRQRVQLRNITASTTKYREPDGLGTNVGTLAIGGTVSAEAYAASYDLLLTTFVGDRAAGRRQVLRGDHRKTQNVARFIVFLPVEYPRPYKRGRVSLMSDESLPMATALPARQQTSDVRWQHFDKATTTCACLGSGNH